MLLSEARATLQGSKSLRTGDPQVIRVIQVIPSLDRAGAEKQMSLLVRHLDRNRFEPYVGVLTRSGPLEAELRAAGIPVYLVGKRHRVDFAAFLRLRQTSLPAPPSYRANLAFCRKCLRPSGCSPSGSSHPYRFRTLRGPVED